MLAVVNVLSCTLPIEIAPSFFRWRCWNFKKISQSLKHIILINHRLRLKNKTIRSQNPSEEHFTWKRNCRAVLSPVEGTVQIKLAQLHCLILWWSWQAAVPDVADRLASGEGSAVIHITCCQGYLNLRPNLEFTLIIFYHVLKWFYNFSFLREEFFHNEFSSWVSSSLLSTSKAPSSALSLIHQG